MCRLEEHLRTGSDLFLGLGYSEGNAPQVGEPFI